MIVILSIYHTYLVFTSQTTKEHLKKIYKDQPNPFKMHPMINFWNILCRGKQSPVSPWLPQVNLNKANFSGTEPQTRPAEVSLTTCQDEKRGENAAQTTILNPSAMAPITALLNQPLPKEIGAIIVVL